MVSRGSQPAGLRSFRSLLARLVEQLLNQIHNIFDARELRDARMFLFLERSSSLRVSDLLCFGLPEVYAASLSRCGDMGARPLSSAFREDCEFRRMSTCLRRTACRPSSVCCSFICFCRLKSIQWSCSLACRDSSTAVSPFGTG